MKKCFSLLFVVISGLLTTTHGFADCPPPNSITVTQQTNGTFTVIPPVPFSYSGDNIPITALGPVSFSSARLHAPHASFDSDGYHAHVVHTLCLYAVGPDAENGLFIIQNRNSFDALLTQTNWWLDRQSDNFLCYAYRGQNCQFSGP